jgi:gamma-glutamylputrescine oxidase
MSSTSFWQADLSPASLPELANGPLRGIQQSDVAIVGAGITGTAAALWLARAGLKVTIVESRRIAAGASGRNAGILANGTTGSYANTIARHGREKARRVWAFTVRNHELAAGLIAEMGEQGWDCGYRRNGGLKLAASPQELTELRKDEALLREDGWEVEPVGLRDIPPRLRLFYRGGSYHPANGEVHPARYVAGMALLASRAGATIYQESPVLSLAEDEQGVTLVTPVGALHANKLILATNAWLPEVGKLAGADWLAKCITPTRGQMIATEPLEELVFPCPCSADHGYQYWRQAEGRLIVGGWRDQSFATEEVAEETPGPEVQQHLDAFVHETLNLPGARIEARWAGIMAFSADMLPLVGRLPGTRHCYLSGGYTGHGNAYSIHAAWLLSEMLQGREPAGADLFDPGRFIE